MTTPPGPPPGPPPEDLPAEDYPEDIPPQHNPSDYWFGPAEQGYPPPQGYHPPPPGYGPHPGYGPPPGYAQGPTKRISVGMIFVGPLLYGAINLVIGFTAFFGSGLGGRDSSGITFALAALVLAAIAFGGGGLLLNTKSPDKRGLGVGLMVGWALMSLFTAGFCTGINPEMYK